MFDRFQSRVVVDGRLRARTAIRVGASKATDPTLPDLPVVRDGAGRPYIPGSTLKGVVRSYVESVLRGIGGERLACDPTTGHGCVPAKSDGSAGCVSMEQLKRENSDAVSLARAVERNVCMVCRVFGSNWLASHVCFDDLPAEGWFGQFQIRNGVSIGRDSGRAADGRLYDFEVVPAGTRFVLRVTLDNGEPWMRGLLELGIRGLTDGQIPVGGARSRGLGSVTVDDLSWQSIETAGDLLAALDADDGRPLTGQSVTQENRKDWIAALRTRLEEEVRGVQATR